MPRPKSIPERSGVLVHRRLGKQPWPGAQREIAAASRGDQRPPSSLLLAISSKRRKLQLTAPKTTSNLCFQTQGKRVVPWCQSGSGLGLWRLSAEHRRHPLSKGGVTLLASIVGVLFHRKVRFSQRMTGVHGCSTTTTHSRSVGAMDTRRPPTQNSSLMDFHHPRTTHAGTQRSHWASERSLH